MDRCSRLYTKKESVVRDIERIKLMRLMLEQTENLSGSAYSDPDRALEETITELSQYLDNLDNQIAEFG